MTVAQVRVVIPDNQSPTIFTDQEIEAYLAIEGGNVLRAAALAIEANASVLAENFVSVRTDDLAVNGASAVEALLRRAKQLRERADKAEETAAADLFTVVYPCEGRRCPELAECRSCACV